MIKRVGKPLTGLWPIMYLPLMANQLAVQLIAWLTLENRHRIQGSKTDDLVNLLDFSIMDVSFISITSPKVAHLECNVVVCNEWASGKTAAKNNKKEDRKNR